MILHVFFYRGSEYLKSPRRKMRFPNRKIGLPSGYLPGFVRLPGLSIGTASAHMGHSAGSHICISSAVSAVKGTSIFALPPLSTIAHAAPTCPPLSRITFITSPVDFPVVITSSTTTAISPGLIKNPLRSFVLHGNTFHSMKTRFLS